jgi:hypothetical protein
MTRNPAGAEHLHGPEQVQPDQVVDARSAGPEQVGGFFDAEQTRFGGGGVCGVHAFLRVVWRVGVGRMGMGCSLGR